MLSPGLARLRRLVLLSTVARFDPLVQTLSDGSLAWHGALTSTGLIRFQSMVLSRELA